jgi:hypothetical protein
MMSHSVNRVHRMVLEVDVRIRAAMTLAAMISLSACGSAPTPPPTPAPNPAPAAAPKPTATPVPTPQATPPVNQPIGPANQIPMGIEKVDEKTEPRRKP